MRIGLSSYSLNSEIQKGNLSLLDAIDFVAAQGGECMELVPFAFKFDGADGAIDRAFIAQVIRRANDAGVVLVNYSILADLCVEGEALDREVARVCHHVDIAEALGLNRMRHDISAFRRPLGENGVEQFDRLLPCMVEGASRVADYAKGKGVTTLVENHGFFANGCDRVERVLNAVARDNYHLLLDTGNIVCVDEDPTVAAIRLSHRARMIHLKDFYVRRDDPGDTTQFDCEGHWFRSMAGRFLRGAILMQGDLDMRAIAKAIVSSGYDGDIVVEFEGMEDARYASRVSLMNARKLFGKA